MDMIQCIQAQLKEDQEVICYTDDNNIVIGHTTRTEMRSQVLHHRCSSIILIQKQTRQLFVHKRTSIKRWYPGCWDISFGGVVAHGESYQENAQRELFEEAGINVESILPLFTFLFEQNKAFNRVFCAEFEGTVEDLNPQKEEVEQVRLITIQEILDEYNNGVQYTPDGMMGLNHYQKYLQGIREEQVVYYDNQ